MVLDLKGKIALITGALSGVGLRYAKELLRNGVRGVTLADTEPNLGKTAVAEIEKEFGPNKAIFVKTNVADIRQFEDAFKKTVDTFRNVDILFNNALILNDSIWEEEIAVNINGVVHGILLGLENYFPKYKQDSEAVIVNISSIAGVAAIGAVPVYCGTKAAVIAMTRSWSDPAHYERSKVRLIAICPGATATPFLFDASGRNLGDSYDKLMSKRLQVVPLQDPDHLAREVVKLVKDSGNGTVWVVERGQPPYQYVVPERHTMKDRHIMNL